uniref:HMG transcription factor n=1 Tax=Zea mays TaxID=4577 RepID=C0HED0_MAIZE
MKTRSQTSPKPLKTVAMAPRPSSTKRKPRPKPAGKGDPRAPKKPPTAFFYFMEDFRKIYKQEKPSVKSMQEIGKACGEKWNTMTFEVSIFSLQPDSRVPLVIYHLMLPADVNCLIPQW